MSPRLRRMSGDEVIAAFRELGFEIAGQSGSHVKLVRVTNEGHRQTLTVPKHKELDVGTLQAIVRQASRYVDERVLRQRFYTNLARLYMVRQLSDRLEQVVRGLAKYDADKAILFGSTARGDTDAWSDIDLIVIKQTDKRFLDRLADVIRCIDPDFALDVLVYTPEEFDQMLADENPFVSTAMEHGKVIYERPERRSRAVA